MLQLIANQKGECLKKTIVIHKSFSSQYDKNDLVSIHRPSLYGNPVRMITGKVGRDDALRQYARFLSGRGVPEGFFNQRITVLLRLVDDLKGKILVCFCKPEKCHGDYLAYLADNGRYCVAPVGGKPGCWIEGPFLSSMDIASAEGDLYLVTPKGSIYIQTRHPV